ncbi:mandelate racemase [Achromatium sp. WMS3]|nr:mandelate racemase [Achromatium sp. WMS3]
MYQIEILKHYLNFKQPASTSRGILIQKPTWFLMLKNTDTNNIGIGEVSLIPGLSVESEMDTENKLNEVAAQPEYFHKNAAKLLSHYPAVYFALEVAFADVHNGGKRLIFDNDFAKGNTAIPINGLIWMGDKKFMFNQIKDKLEQGFSCIKLKIGAIDFDQEIDLLRYIRTQFNASEIELRVDANGAFSPEKALEKLQILSNFKLHSIEQPIQQGKIEEMAWLCEKTPLPIALDEELIGISEQRNKLKLLQTIKPQYIVLKPSLVGGLASSDEWISIAEPENVGWWATSALESNIGLNAIAQWIATKDTKMLQGLGTGGLFSNNIDSPLSVENGYLYYNPKKGWGDLG